MPTAVTLTLEGVTLQGELDDSPAAQALAARLPLSLTLSRWGEEYYGDVGEPLGSFEGEQVEEMAVGELAYWEPGNALCLFFGPTPASRGDEPRAASPVYRVGRVEGDWAAVSALGASVRATLARAE
jgi:hypothetical protein